MTLIYPGISQRLYMSKLFRKPIQMIRETVSKMIKGKDKKSDVKYLFYSAHDM